MTIEIDYFMISRHESNMAERGFESVTLPPLSTPGSALRGTSDCAIERIGRIRSRNCESVGNPSFVLKSLLK